jgi:hypothetical protein
MNRRRSINESLMRTRAAEMRRGQMRELARQELLARKRASQVRRQAGQEDEDGHDPEQ